MDEDSVEEYLQTHHKTNILQIIQDVDIKKHYSININFVELFENDTVLGNTILKNSERALDELDQRIQYVQEFLAEEFKDEVLHLKPNVHARVYGLPACPELHRNIFPKNEDLDLFLQVSGTVVRVTATKMLEYQRPYMCTKCKHIEMIEAVYEQKYAIIPPKRCLNPEKCSGTNLISAGDLSVDNCKDYQEIKIQEQASKLGVGTMPSAMWVTLEDDLVDACKPGDDVTICGTVKRRWGALVIGKRIEVELVLKANHIQVNNGHTSPSLITPEIREQFRSFWEKHKSCPLEGRDLILKSFCPKLYGLYIVKLAMAVVLAGGSRCTQGNEMGIQIRSEPHILLVGDPGTGKSQLLRYAAKVIPRSILTTGVGTTSAGLTVAAVMEDGQWQLEGGALVLADGGICCIDEFNSMKAHDRTSIHEAMEQQTISVAKASMVCKLRTRCSILAATNPKGGHLDPSQPLSLNLALPSPLLSRFDLVLMLKDYYNNEWDNLVADHILSGKGDAAVKADPSLWNLETLQNYFTIIRSINPMLTPQANRILSNYYQAQRRAVSRNKARTTMRLLDSLVRLSQAHARLMFHKEVHVMDALFAVLLIESSMHGECAVLSSEGVNVQAPFLTAPMENYIQLAKSVLSKLGLNDILRSEISFLNGSCEYNPELSVNNQESSTNDKSNETLFEDCSFVKDHSVCSETSNIEEHSMTNNNVNNFQTTVESFKKPNAVENKSENEILVEDIVSKNTNNGESEKENEPKINSHGVADIPVSKKENENIKRVEQKKEIEAETDKFTANRSEKRKRKNTKLQEQAKQSKLAKKTSALNDFQMLNLIPSVNDEFDLSILNFANDEPVFNNKTVEAAEDERLILNTINNETKRNINDESFSAAPINVNSTEKPTTSTTREIAKFKSKDQFPQPVMENCEPSKTFNANAIEKLSQNTKLNRFREKFSFKPRNESHWENVDGETMKPLYIKNLDNVPTNSNNNVSSNTPAMTVSQRLCKSQDQDYDSLDFETLTTSTTRDVAKLKSEDQFPQPVMENCEPSKTFNANAIEKLSQNTKLNRFREKFSFKPRNGSDCEKADGGTIKPLNIKNLGNVPTNRNNSVSINAPAMTVSQRLFKSQDQDYDSLDFEF